MGSQLPDIVRQITEPYLVQVVLGSFAVLSAFVYAKSRDPFPAIVTLAVPLCVYMVLTFVFAGDRLFNGLIGMFDGKLSTPLFYRIIMAVFAFFIMGNGTMLVVLSLLGVAACTRNKNRSRIGRWNWTLVVALGLTAFSYVALWALTQQD
jgi:hypothetical protein